jgi:hypothetical protein
LRLETQIVDLNLGLVGTNSSLDELRKVFASFQDDSEFGFASLKADIGSTQNHVVALNLILEKRQRDFESMFNEIY